MTDEERQAKERRLRMFIRLTGQTAVPFYDASQEVNHALAAVDAGDYQTAVLQMKAIRARLAQLQQEQVKPMV